MDIITNDDGSLFVSDDNAGKIYRVYYEKLGCMMSVFIRRMRNLLMWFVRMWIWRGFVRLSGLVCRSF